MKKIAIFGSGRGSNFESIYKYISRGIIRAKVEVVISDKQDALILKRAKEKNIPSIYVSPKNITREEFFRNYDYIKDYLSEEDKYYILKASEKDPFFSSSRYKELKRILYDHKIYHTIKAFEIDGIILAGYMRIVSRYLIDKFPNKILNIHPSLLPSFIGLNAQKQAFEYGVKISGATVHIVNEILDGGPIIIQAATFVKENDSIETLKERILKYEHKIYPQAVKWFCEDRLKIEGRKVKINLDDLNLENIVNNEALISPGLEKEFLT
jgi:phosphoribosylglycinamide formyltransferase-1